MNNTVESIGLRVLNVSPANREKNVNVNSDIKVEFNSDIDPSTLVKNIVVLEDYNKNFKGAQSLTDYSKYAVVKGSISYSNKILTFTPESPFRTGIGYILMLNDTITDVTGNKLVKKHVSSFYTEIYASFPQCTITSPKYGLITSSVPDFTWVNLGAPSYVFQVSKMNTFEILLCDEFIVGNGVSEFITYTPETSVFKNEGIYFIRVKAENSAWSDTIQIFIKQITDAVVAHEDTPDIQNLDEFLDGLEEEIEILEQFPESDSINNSIKTNIIYVKVAGKLDEASLHIDNCWVYGESSDDNHEEYSQGELPGSWTVIYDSYYDVSYVIFTPFDVDEDGE